MSDSKTAGIILAAGASARFGRPKQLARLRGKPLLTRVLDAAVQSDLDRVVLVLGCAHRQIAARLNEHLLDAGIRPVINHEYRRGQGSSLRLGLSKVPADFAAAMFLLADQPLVTASLINRLLAANRRSQKGICLPAAGGRPGNPVIFDSKYFEALMRIEGDRGGREIIRSHPHDVLKVEIDCPHALVDIDTPEDLAALNALMD